MDRDLIARIVITSLLVAAFLVASMTGFHVTIVGPAVVIAIAVVMFWPRRAEARSQRADGEQVR
ncbi:MULTISPECIES: hypothetical protein [unclassified Corynebacterium]|uniref:hypothetical protein n=1 Tax=unclassified Corynebacterium TaxID=2624378 RepID=UPI002A91E878|nr:hypothetical protein [Corynebacterium sp.]MDY5784623.1 hypothetical protein [Corynebacterium sp.]